MATTVRITFTGLCYFEPFDDGNGDTGVRVVLPTASREAEYCANHQPHTLKAHQARMITTRDHVDPNQPHEKTDFEIDGLNVDITGRGTGLVMPTDLASVRQVSKRPNAPAQPQSSRVLAEFHLRGGSFGVMCRKASNAVSEGWTQGSLRWQDTWAGIIEQDELTLPTSSGSITLQPVGPMIDLTIVNLMPNDVARWLQPDTVPLPAGHSGPAEDFRWFYWMLGWEDADICRDQDQKIPTRAPSAAAGVGASGLPYTCVGAGP